MGMGSVYFFCFPHGPADRAGYEHEIICLAEGLRLLNIQYSGNIDYWMEGNSPGDFLIRHDPSISYQEADIVVFSSVIYDYESTHLLPQDLFSPNRLYRLVFIDASDDLWTPGFRDEMRSCDMVLKCHYNRKYPLPDNFRPWAFGISSRILDQLAVNPASSTDGISPRKAEILVNYRFVPSLRERAMKEILPLFDDVLKENRTTDSYDPYELSDKDRLYWAQSGRRHYPSYYRRLLDCEACSCFGGNLEKWTTHREGKFWNVVRKVDGKLSLFRDDRVYQFDSWRFWESFAARTCVFHVNLEKYGCVLPVMPVNMVHYLGFDLEKPMRIVNMIHDDPALLRTIGNAGKSWVFDNYSPKAVAERFLELAASSPI